MRPRIERPDDLPTLVGVRTALLARARVADVRARSVADEPQLAVELVWPEVLALWALPVVVGRVIGEPGGAVTQRAPVRVRRQPLERERAAAQAAGVPCGKQDFRAHTSLAAAASSSP